MLKSTHKPSAASLAALPPGWTEHQAPSGHTYYYNAQTKESTYKRPVPESLPQPAALPPAQQYPYTDVPSLADPNVANAYLAQFNQAPSQPQSHRGGHHGGSRGGYEGRPRPQPMDKPRRKEPIPGCEPWILVYTKYSRRFVYNPVKNTSYWRIPEKLMPGILELDKARIRGKATEEEAKQEKPEDKAQRAPSAPLEAPAGEDDSEYEEVEVTDDEDAANDEFGDEGHTSKRQRTEDAEPEDEEGPVEFTEADIAMQLQAMGAEYGLDPGEYDDGHADEWPEGAEGMPLSEEDGKYLFKDLLNDLAISPYSPWDKLLEDGRMVDDVRYTALPTTKARRECWDEWTREKIAALKDLRARQEKTDPRVAYMALLAAHATPKLYWPEFKRKYRREPAMRDLNLPDRDREKAYRDLVSRLKQPLATRKADLTALLRAQPPHALHSGSLTTGLPTAVLVDVRYAALEASVRDALVEAYVATLPPAPEDVSAAAKDDEERRKTREAREKRERALEERNRAVEEQRRRREREVAASKARLREEERELEMAMRVGKGGLQSQLEKMRERTVADGEKEEEEEAS